MSVMDSHAVAKTLKININQLFPGTNVNIHHKTSVEGTLKVEILKGQEVVSSMETATPFWIITLGKMPDKDSIINQILGKILG